MDELNTHFMAGQIYKGFLYASCYEYNGLFKMNIETGETFFLGIFPGESIIQRALYRDAVLVENTIVFIPDSAEKMVLYEIEKNQFEVVALPIERDGWCAYNAVENNMKIYLIPIELDKEILVYDMVSKKFVINDFTEKIHAILIEKKNAKAYKIGSIGKTLWIPVIGTAICLCLDLETGKVVSHTYKADIINIVREKEGYWLCLKDNTMVLSRNINSQSECEFAGILRIDSSQVICEYDDGFLLFNKDSVRIQKYNDRIYGDADIINGSFIRWMHRNVLCFFRTIFYKDMKVIISVNMDGILVLKKNDILFVKMQDNITETQDSPRRNIEKELQASDKILTESETFDLKLFLSFI